VAVLATQKCSLDPSFLYWGDFIIRINCYALKRTHQLKAGGF